MQRPRAADRGARCSTAPGGCSCSRTSSTTPTSGRCSAAPRRSGVDAVLVTPRCADPLYRRSIRVSMGTVFQVPWTRIDPWPGGSGAAARRWASPWRPWPWRTTRWASTSWPPTRPSGSPWCSAPRATGCRGARSPAVDLTVRIPMAGGRRLAQRRRGRRRGGLGAAGAGLTGVRIVVSGTHASGKSTLVSDLAAALRVRPAARPLRAGRRRSSRAGAESFVAQLESRRSGSSSCPPAPTSSPSAARVDFLAYLEALADLGRRSASPDAPRRPARRHAPRRWPTSTCSSCSRSRCPTSSGCPTTRTPSCGRRWTRACSTCATTTTSSGRTAGWSRSPARPRRRVAQVARRGRGRSGGG